MNRELYNRIINLIPSKSLKDKIKDLNFKVDDMDLVYIVDNYETNILEKSNYLTQLLNCKLDNKVIVKIQKILEDIEKAKNEINDNITTSKIYDEYRDYQWDEANEQEIEDYKFRLIINEYKPNWPIFLNKFDLVKIKEQYNNDNYCYGFITHFQEQMTSPKATICLFESVEDEDLNAKIEYLGNSYYVLPYNYSHDHIYLECIEKEEVECAPENIKQLYNKIMDTISDRVKVGKYFYSKTLSSKFEKHKFTDLEKANIIDSSIYPFNEKLKDLEQLMEYTIDNVLYKQLKHYIKAIMEIPYKISEINKNELYEVIDSNHNKYYLKGYEEAIKIGIDISDLNKTFQIKKIKIGTEHYDSKIYLYNNKGEIIWTNQDLFENYQPMSDFEELFFNSYINIPNVFDDEYKVIKRYFPVPEFDDAGYDILSNKQINKFNFRDNIIEKGIKLDLIDSGPYVCIIIDNGEVYNEPYPSFVNMYYVDEKEYTLAMIMDIEFLRKKDKE